MRGVVTLLGYVTAAECHILRRRGLPQCLHLSSVQRWAVIAVLELVALILLHYLAKLLLVLKLDILRGRCWMLLLLLLVLLLLLLLLTGCGYHVHGLLTSCLVQAGQRNTKVVRKPPLLNILLKIVWIWRTVHIGRSRHTVLAKLAVAISWRRYLTLVSCGSLLEHVLTLPLTHQELRQLSHLLRRVSAIRRHAEVIHQAMGWKDRH